MNRGLTADEPDRARAPGAPTVAPPGEAIVGGVIGPPHLPTALVLGRHDHCGRLRVIGRTHPLPRAAREQVGALLRPPARPHPWPTTLPVPAGRFGLPGGDPVEHTAVEPALVVEIETDPNVEGAVIGMARSSCVRGLSWTRDIFRR